MEMKRRDLLAAGVGAIVATALAGGVAWAAIPGPGGVIQGCYRDKRGDVKVVESLPCPKGYSSLPWNEQGVPGAPGADGADGVSPTVAQLSPGDTNCPAGGAAITDANGTAAYVCSGEDGADGEPFSGTFTSPNGQYSLTVSDSGITIANGSNTRILIQGGTIDARAMLNLDLRAQNQLNARSNVAANIDAAFVDIQGVAATNVGATGVLDLRGAQVRVNGAGCRPAARVGDLVIVPPGSAVGSITLGSPTVCIG
jgi:hypothetical protein